MNDKQVDRSISQFVNVNRPPGRSLPEKVLQFGEGNFLRGFANWMVDALNRRGLFGGSVLVASGEVHTQAEINGYREIAIFKDGVTL